MAETQGDASVLVRGASALVTAVSTVSGRRDDDGVWRGLGLVDDDAFRASLVWNGDDSALGAAVRDALLKSRLNVARSGGSSADYDLGLARAFGLSTARRLYAGTKLVSVHWTHADITLVPTKHRRGSAFDGFPLNADWGHEDIVVPFTSTDAKLGAAIRECVARCL